MLFSAINYPLCFWEGTRKNCFPPGVVVARERDQEELLLAGASVVKTTLFALVVSAALREAASALGEEEGTGQRPGAQSHSWVLL